MVTTMIIVFFLALIGIVALFTLKRWELARERVLFPSFRTRADSEALHLKDLFAAQNVVHGMAVDAGHIAHWLGAQSHRLADSVSHKRNFERGQTKSEFLKKVSEHKNGNADGDDTTSTV